MKCTILIWHSIRRIPLEVKAETKIKTNDLKQYRDSYQPQMSMRISLQNYKKEEGLLNLPLWAVDSLKDEIANFI